MIKVYFSILIIIIILLPLLINMIGNNFLIKSEADFGDWIGFWGGYFGGIFGSLAVIITTYMIIQHEKKLSERAFLEQIKLQKETMVEQDKMEKSRIKIQYKLIENDELYKKLMSLQSLFLATHNKIMELVVIKEAMHLNEREYSLQEIINNRDIGMKHNNEFRDSLIDISAYAETELITNYFNDLLSIVEGYKKILLNIRKENFSYSEAFQILENSNKTFSEVWKYLIITQLETRKILLNKLN